MSTEPLGDASVEAAFAAYPKPLRGRLLTVRSLILGTAREIAGVGPLVECLKWGQPAYLPARPRIDTTVRLDAL